MSQATKFLFDNDFRNPGADAKSRAAVEEAEKAAFARGLAQGRAEAEARIEARLADASARLAEQVRRLLQQAEAEAARLEREAVDLALAAAAKIAGEALSRHPLDTIEATARQAFEHLRGVPHLAVRVNDALVDAVDTLIKRLAREKGFEGRLVVLGEPQIPPGDARLEWADGGIVRDAEAIANGIRRAAGAAPTGHQ